MKLHIIGLGVKRILWARLSKLLSELLRTDGIEAEFGYYHRKGLNGYKKYLEKSGKGDADIIITSFGFFDDLHVLEQLINENSAFSKGGPPRVFFLEKDISRFLTDLLKNRPSVRFNMGQFGELQIQDPGFFLMPGEEQLLLEIDPLPEIISSSTDERILTGETNTVFYPLGAVTEVIWQEQHYTAADFVDKQFQRFSTKRSRKNARLIVKENEKVYISSGLPLTELNAITFNYMQIEHVLSFDQLKGRTSDFDLFLIKFRELAKSRYCRVFGEQKREDVSVIKSSTPITVCSDYPVVNDIFSHVLIADGYQGVLTTEQTIDQSNRLLLSLTDSYDEPEVSSLSRSLMLEKEIFNIAGFPKVTRKMSASPPDINSVDGIDAIRTERAQLIKKLKKLEDQIKNLSGSKILADQEKYMNMLAGRKLEILTVLLEMAAIWDENDEKQKRTYEENVLILHDDSIQASTINNQLEGDGKRLFVDVMKKFSTLKAFVTLNTDILEPFLHEGFIFCYAASKSISVRKLKQFQNELSDKKYPEIAKGIENLKAERARLQKRLMELAYLEAFQMLKTSYQDQADRVFLSAKNAQQYLQNRRFSQDAIRSICLFSSDADQCLQVRNALAQSFKGLKKSHFDTVLLPLNLSTKLSTDESAGLEELSSNETTKDALVQEAVIQNNVRALHVYLKKAIKEFSVVSTDLLVLVHDLDIITMLVRDLRQAGKKFSKVPILAVFSGSLKTEKMVELADNGVILAYNDRLFNTRCDDLLDQLRALFS